jgi:type III secretion protein D
VSQRADGEPLVRGVVPDQNAAALLKTRLQQANPRAQLQLRTGEAIADDVSEFLRLNGIEAVARYLGEGRVEVRGHLGAEEPLAQAIQSRAMRDIRGLRQVMAINLDGPTHADPTAAKRGGGSAKRVVTVVAGSDPYLVTADGSRYYVGAQLPDGRRLAAVESNEILLQDGQQQERKPGVGTVLAGS